MLQKEGILVQGSSQFSSRPIQQWLKDNRFAGFTVPDFPVSAEPPWSTDSCFLHQHWSLVYDSRFIRSSHDFRNDTWIQVGTEMFLADHLHAHLQRWKKAVSPVLLLFSPFDKMDGLHLTPTEGVISCLCLCFSRSISHLPSFFFTCMLKTIFCSKGLAYI